MINMTRGFLLPLLFVFCVQAQAQSIADAARQERERQKSLHSAIVITNENLKELSPSSPSNKENSTPAATPATAAKKDESDSGILKDNKGRDEKYWRETFATARQDLKRAQDVAEVLQLKINDLNTALLRQDDMYNKENILGPQITAAKAQLDDAQKQVAAAQQKISDLEDELRQSGGPPGWAR
jgi:chromosome segregation ATPase